MHKCKQNLERERERKRDQNFQNKCCSFQVSVIVWFIALQHTAVYSVLCSIHKKGESNSESEHEMEWGSESLLKNASWYVQAFLLYCSCKKKIRAHCCCCCHLFLYLCRSPSCMELFCIKLFAFLCVGWSGGGGMVYNPGKIQVEMNTQKHNHCLAHSKNV